MKSFKDYVEYRESSYDPFAGLNKSSARNYGSDSLKAAGVKPFDKRPPHHDEWQCPRCETWNSTNNRECANCGRNHGGGRVATREGGPTAIQYRQEMVESAKKAVAEIENYLTKSKDLHDFYYGSERYRSMYRHDRDLINVLEKLRRVK